MNELPKNIDTQKELVSYMSKWQHLYSIDDFMQDFEVSERTAKELLKDIDHISITQSLFTQLKPTIKRKKFYDPEKLFKSLVKQNKIKYTLKYTPAKLVNGKPEKIYKKSQSKKIPTSMVLEHWDLFYETTVDYSATTSKVAERYAYNLNMKKNINNYYHKIAGIETVIGNGTRRIHVFAPELRYRDKIIIHWLYLELFKEK